MWLFTKLGTGKGPEVVNHDPGQVCLRFDLSCLADTYMTRCCQVYKIKFQMAPRSDEELLQAAREYTSILLVRWRTNHFHLDETLPPIYIHILCNT